MVMLPKLMYRFSAISTGFDAEIDKLIIKFTWECKEPKRTKSNLKKKVGGLTLPNLKTDSYL